MNYIIFSYDGTGRDLKRIIISLLKSGNAISIQKFNYVQDFLLDENGKVKKIEIKLVIIKSNDEQKLMVFLEKNFPQLKKVTHLSGDKLGVDQN